MADMHPGHDLPATPPGDAISVRGIAIAGGLVLAAILTSVGVAFGLLHVWLGNPQAGTAPEPGEPPRIAGPRLEPDPAHEIAVYRAGKERLLHGYAWVDRAHGIVRIPIERAMQMLAAGQAPEAPR